MTSDRRKREVLNESMEFRLSKELEKCDENGVFHSGTYQPTQLDCWFLRIYLSPMHGVDWVWACLLLGVDE